MIIVLAILGVLLGFSVAVNIVLLVGYGQQVKENEHLKHEDRRLDLTKKELWFKLIKKF